MHIEIVQPLIGGALMGVAASLFLWTHGRMTGIAGLYSGALERVSDWTMRFAFIAGLVASGIVVRWFAPATLPGGGSTSLGVVLVAGLLVGFGARLGSGCTSGHGICGVSRLSRRALAATGVFMMMGVLISGMANPAKVIGFLDIAGSWDPSLMFVMVGAIGVHAIFGRLALRSSKPLFAADFVVPKNQKIDGELVAGAAVFGIGWGLAGFCPGPALVFLATRSTNILAFIASMTLGMMLYRLTRRTAANPADPAVAHSGAVQ